MVTSLCFKIVYLCRPIGDFSLQWQFPTEIKFNICSIVRVHVINEFKCYEVKIEESEKLAVARSQTQDTWLEPPVLCH